MSAKILENDKISLQISPETGGGVAALKFHNGRNWVDILRPATAAALTARDPQRMGCFASIPYVSRIRDGRFGFGGREYRLPPNQPPSAHPLHGVVWRRPGNITDQTADHVTVTHDISEEDLPYRFSATQAWTVSGDTLSVTLSVTNTGAELLPFGLGLHPFFNKTPQARIKTQVAKIITNDADVIPVSLDPLTPEQDFTREFKTLSRLPVDNCFTGWSRMCEIEWPDLNAAITMTADPVFSFFVVCAPETENWFCANPVTHFNDAFNNPIGLRETGLKTLATRQTLSGTIALKLRALAA